MKPEAIIFDLDGTLLDSATDILASIRLALRTCELEVPSSLDASLIGPPIHEILAQTGMKMTDSVRAKVVDQFRQIYDNSELSMTRPYPGASSLLQRCRSLTIRSFVATNKPIKPTTKLIDRWFPSFFREVVCVNSGSMGALSKTAMVASLIRAHALEPRRTIVLGDGVSDIRAAVDNQCRAFGVSFGYGDPEDLESNGAERSFSSLDEFAEEVFSK